ncbi:unnamed protein product [Urochloa humidicola]
MWDPNHGGSWYTLMMTCKASAVENQSIYAQFIDQSEANHGADQQQFTLATRNTFEELKLLRLSAGWIDRKSWHERKLWDPNHGGSWHALMICHKASRVKNQTMNENPGESTSLDNASST